MNLNISNPMSMSSAPKSISSDSKLIASNMAKDLDPDPGLCNIVYCFLSNCRMINYANILL
ncbi:hypothetical protein LguiB_026368 [Lonicera macranthoides]